MDDTEGSGSDDDLMDNKPKKINITKIEKNIEGLKAFKENVSKERVLLYKSKTEWYRNPALNPWNFVLAMILLSLNLFGKEGFFEHYFEV